MNITGIKALSSTSFQVVWKRLSIENITGYTVCYHLNSPVTCSSNKTVDGNTLSVIIKGLNEFTRYYAAAFASSASGASGDGVGNEVEITTYEDSKFWYYVYKNSLNSASLLYAALFLVDLYRQPIDIAVNFLLRCSLARHKL